MVTYAELRDLDTSRMTTAASTAGTLSGDLNTRGAEVTSAAEIPTGTWNGNDRDAASQMISPLADPLYDTSDSCVQSQGVLEDLVGDLESAQERLQDAHNMAAGTGITISADGTVTTPVVDTPEEASANEERARQIRNIIDEAVEEANEADRNASGTLQGLAGALGTLGEVNGRVGQLAKFMTHHRLGVFQPRVNGRWASPSDFTRFQQGRMAMDPSNWRAKPHQAGNRAAWLRAGRITSNVARPLAPITAGVTQAAEDWNNPDLSGGEKTGRVANAAVTEGGGAIAGAAGGAKVGALAGAVLGPKGAIVGGVVGGVIGGIGGSAAGQWIGDKTQDIAGAAGDWAGDRVSDAGDALGSAKDWAGDKLSSLNPF